jgi:trk system potassium uptake protein TrkA
MKYTIIGMGSFGAFLAQRLTALGHEVVGVDSRPNRIELIKDNITHAVVMDATDLQAVKTLPMRDCDVVIIAIGEDVGASIMATAIFKQINPKRIIGRAINALHETVIRAIGVDEIIHPEEETAQRLATRLELKGVLDSLEISDDYNIVEVKLPTRYIGLTIVESNIQDEFSLNILFTIKMKEKSNLLGMKSLKKEVEGVIKPDYIFSQEDILLIFGMIKDIRRFLDLES